MKKQPDFIIPGHEFYRGTFIPEGDEVMRALIDREWQDPLMRELKIQFANTTDAHDEVLLLDAMNQRSRELSEPEANQ